jgi:FkbM family methyltransferase
MKLFVADTDFSLAPHLVFEGYWESWITTVVIEKITPGMRIVNVGANVGYYVMLFADLIGAGGHVYAYEPAPMLAQMIWDSANINGFRNRVTVKQCAVAQEKGRSTIRYSPLSPMNGTLMESAATSGDFPIHLDVDVTALDDEIEEADLIFVDSEGFEPFVVGGAKKLIERCGPELCLEWAPERYEDPKAFIALLKSFGYKPSIVTTEGRIRRITWDTLTLTEEITIWLSM